MKGKKLFFMECHLAGRKYHDADEVWEELKVGTKLTLVRDLDNRFDPNAVAVVYKKHNSAEDKTETFLLDYIPKTNNYIIAQLLPFHSHLQPLRELKSLIKEYSQRDDIFRKQNMLLL